MLEKRILKLGNDEGLEILALKMTDRQVANFRVGPL